MVGLLVLRRRHLEQSSLDSIEVSLLKPEQQSSSSQSSEEVISTKPLRKQLLHRRPPLPNSARSKVKGRRHKDGGSVGHHSKADEEWDVSIAV